MTGVAIIRDATTGKMNGVAIRDATPGQKSGVSIGEMLPSDRSGNKRCYRSGDRSRKLNMRRYRAAKCQECVPIRAEDATGRVNKYQERVNVRSGNKRCYRSGDRSRNMRRRYRANVKSGNRSFRFSARSRGNRRCYRGPETGLAIGDDASGPVTGVTT
jgi:hypothetical protein